MRGDSDTSAVPEAIGVKMAGLFRKKKDIYEDVKYLFKELIISRGKEFDMQWLKNNLTLVKETFTKKPNLHIHFSCDKDHFTEILYLDDIILEEDRFIMKAKNLRLDFYNPSHGNFEVSKGTGNMYGMHLYSKKNTPSKLSLAYYNI